MGAQRHEMPNDFPGFRLAVIEKFKRIDDEHIEIREEIGEVGVSCKERFDSVLVELRANTAISADSLAATRALTDAFNQHKESLSTTIAIESGGKKAAGFIGWLLGKFVQIGELGKKYLVSFIVVGLIYGVILSVILGRKSIADMAMEILKIFIKP